MKTEKHYLKDIEEIMNINPHLKYDPEYRAYISTRNLNWHINDKMLKKFGDGKRYPFWETAGSSNSYTHKGEDGYFYHSSWFADVPPETIDTKPTEFAKPIHVNIDDLEIPEV
jgi:hypothetical protein